MKHMTIVALLPVTLLSLATAISQPPAARRTIISSLRVGQAVMLRDRGSLFEISSMNDIGLGTHKVVEVSESFVVVQDVADVTVSSIPITAIRAIIDIRTKKK